MRKQQNRSRTTRKSSSAPHSAKAIAHTVYAEFEIYSGSKAPRWHPIKKMRYVFFRMIGGCTITDAVREIHWDAAEFWHLVDLARHAPFRNEYRRAKLLQGRAFADSVVTIAEGRDAISRRSMKKLVRIITRGLRRTQKSKSSLASKMLVDSLLSRINDDDRGLIARNKLQIDAAKWIAKATNPQEFSESSRVSLGSSTDDDAQKPILVQFVGPDGKVVPI